MMPRDRDGSFDPVTIPKHQRRLDGLTGNVISLYAKGMTTGDIQAHLAEIYDTTVSRETISKITDAIVEDMVAWQNRPLDPLYTVLLIDAIVIKVRGSQVANRPVYVAIGVNLDGERDVLGMWLGPPVVKVPSSGRRCSPSSETAASRMRSSCAVTDSKVCRSRFAPLGPTQPFKPVSCTWCATACAMPPRNTGHRSCARCATIYEAPTTEAAEADFAEFSEQWQDTYPAMIRSWENNWAEFVPFLEFPAELRKIVYTTNAIESLNARFRRAVRHRGHFPNEQSALKVLYLVSQQNRPGRANLIGRTNGWKTILNALTIHYGDRIANHYYQ